MEKRYQQRFEFRFCGKRVGYLPTDAIPAQAPAVRRHGVLRFSSPEYVFNHYVIGPEMSRSSKGAFSRTGLTVLSASYVVN